MSEQFKAIPARTSIGTQEFYVPVNYSEPVLTGQTPEASYHSNAYEIGAQDTARTLEANADPSQVKGSLRNETAESRALDQQLEAMVDPANIYRLKVDLDSIDQIQGRHLSKQANTSVKELMIDGYLTPNRTIKEHLTPKDGKWDMPIKSEIPEEVSRYVKNMLGLSQDQLLIKVKKPKTALRPEDDPLPSPPPTPTPPPQKRPRHAAPGNPLPDSGATPRHAVSPEFEEYVPFKYSSEAASLSLDDLKSNMDHLITSDGTELIPGKPNNSALQKREEILADARQRLADLEAGRRVAPLSKLKGREAYAEAAKEYKKALEDVGSSTVAILKAGRYPEEVIKGLSVLGNMVEAARYARVVGDEVISLKGIGSQPIDKDQDFFDRTRQENLHRWAGQLPDEHVLRAQSANEQTLAQEAVAEAAQVLGSQEGKRRTATTGEHTLLASQEVTKAARKKRLGGALLSLVRPKSNRLREGREATDIDHLFAGSQATAQKLTGYLHGEQEEEPVSPASPEAGRYQQ